MKETKSYSAINQIPLLLNWLQQRAAINQPVDPFFLQQLDECLAFKLKGAIPDSIDNTYLKEYAVPQIVLFDLLANRFPLVKAAQQLVENSFLHFIGNARHICIIDLGIGRGLQAMQWLRALCTAAAPESVTVIGVELTAPALMFTKSQFESTKNDFSCSFNFHLLHMPMEDVTARLLRTYIPAQSDCLFVNASLSMHHIQSNEVRVNLLNEIRTLSPGLFTLTEPNADTFTDVYDVRLLNAVEHFSALFNYVNSLALTENEKQSLKTFFSNDFFDPVALPDSHRFEKLLPAASWIHLFKSAGFSSFDLSSYAAEPDGFSYTTDESHVTYSFEDVPLLSVMGFN